MQLKQIAIHKEEKPKMNEEHAINKSELLEQKEKVEERIRRAERKEIDDRVLDSLKKIKDINDSVADLQYALNTVWKRSKQIEEELTEIITMPPLSMHRKITS